MPEFRSHSVLCRYFKSIILAVADLVLGCGLPTQFAKIPDVILLDVRISGSDGRELCKEIREKYKLNIPIILVSASPELLKDYMGCKPDDIIEKPFNLETVIGKVNNVINKYKGIVA